LPKTRQTPTTTANRCKLFEISTKHPPASTTSQKRRYRSGQSQRATTEAPRPPLLISTTLEEKKKHQSEKRNKKLSQDDINKHDGREALQKTTTSVVLDDCSDKNKQE
jgi:hypothetical protein